MGMVDDRMSGSEMSIDTAMEDGSASDNTATINASTEEETNRSIALAQAADFLQDRTVSEIRAFANMVNVDISNCSDRDDMVETLLKAAEHRSQLVSYLSALAPLAGQSVSQLRAIARTWGVYVGDCLEKGEIIHRLAFSIAGRAS